MSKVEAVILSTKPFRPTDFNEKAMAKVINESYLIADVKKDGVRLNLCVGSRQPLVNVEWLSREGKRFPALVQYLQADPRWDKFYNPNLGEGMFSDSGFMLDAELILTDAEGNEKKCKNISGDLRRKEEPVPMDRIRVYVFDIVPLDVIESSREYEVMTSVRKMHVEYQVAKLKKTFPEIDWRVGETYEVFSMETMPVMQRESLDEDGNVITVDLPPPLSANRLYEVVRERGEEGLVMKDPMGNYRRSKCSGWWKMVPDDNEDGRVSGLVWGTDGLANEGKVIGFKVTLESGHVVNACKISRKLMEAFTASVLGASRNAYGDGNFPDDGKGGLSSDLQDEAVNPYDGFSARVTFMERYPDGSLRHPSFDEFRGISSPYIKE